MRKKFAPSKTSSTTSKAINDFARVREGDLWRRARERAAALGVAGQHGRLLRAARPRRHNLGDELEPRWAPHARQPGQLLRPLLQGRAVRRARVGPTPRLRAARGARARASSEADRRRL